MIFYLVSFFHLNFVYLIFIPFLVEKEFSSMIEKGNARTQSYPWTCWLSRAKPQKDFNLLFSLGLGSLNFYLRKKIMVLKNTRLRWAKRKIHSAFRVCAFHWENFYEFLSELSLRKIYSLCEVDYSKSWQKELLELKFFLKICFHRSLVVRS